MRQTIIKGGEFVEGSKFYREMDSSIRIPSTDEDYFIRKWQHEDQTYHAIRLETQDKKREIFDRAKRHLKWNAGVKGSQTFTDALLINSENLQSFHTFLIHTFEVVEYVVYCQDNTELCFSGVEKILRYENPNHKYITGVNWNA